MPGTEPYITPCNACGKQIILGIDAETNKWRPWDNYAAKAKHNCTAKTQAQATTINATSATGLSEQDIQAIASIVVAAIQKALEPIAQGVSMGNWLDEKIAKKVGVDDLIENQNG
jgi:hypothetical protein